MYATQFRLPQFSPSIANGTPNLPDDHIAPFVYERIGDPLERVARLASLDRNTDFSGQVKSY